MQVKTGPRAVGPNSEVKRYTGRVDTSTEGPPSLSTEEVFQLLSNRRRRYALHYLDQVEDPVTIRDLSEQIAAWEYEIDRQDVSPTVRKRIYTALHQGHLPKMDRLGVIDYDNDRGTVCSADRVRDFDVYLDVVPGGNIPWATYYLGLSGLAASVTLAAWVGIYPETVPTLVWPTLITLAFDLSALAHVWARRQQTVNFADLFRNGDS